MENAGGKRVLLTSNGDQISQSIAFHLAKHGCRVVLMGDESCLRSIGEGIMASLNSVVPVEVVGLNMEEEKEAVFEEAVNKACNLLGKLDAFVNCYTYEGKMQEHLELGEEELKKIMQINYLGAWYLLKAAGKKMRDFKRGGSIIFLTSIMGGQRGLYPGSAAYASTLAAVHQLVGAPLGRWLDVKRDLASMVMYLISDGSRYMTGTTIYVDGAQSLTRPRLRSYM
ncbi:levodione reductase-like [Senna tora]|uniref:Levodione reductase-like n=1 Tax=Senna tora TaxID=362788 RepID=A0A834TC75_9FABA|nr:levodione reductase-like [Senna tora]